MAGGGSADGEDLNLIPYLDIMVNLVIFLLFSFQVVIEMVRIDLLSPAYGGGAGGGENNAEANKQLTVVITTDGFRLLSSDPSVKGQESIPLVNGKHDIEGLHAKLVELKQLLKLGNSLILTADTSVSYKTVVETMDAARTDGSVDLFPDVLLARSGGTVVQ